MQRRILGNGLEVSAIGLGCMGMTSAYGPPADKGEMIAPKVSPVIAAKAAIHPSAARPYDDESPFSPE